ncbi:glycosyltransferase [Vibrio vulnificus]|uniref:glycosyltransferase n=1 Tax=Vibrio vulnificus TaxID=672 RepID=UPI00076B3C1C|nr:glycosyltransferase [Vibrio vulnificus]AMG13755.1 hypothetical protein AL549_21435 [Vibrio vulnificus]EGQ7995976.1 glycosyltransferase family 4 protein [Vibrio vulnificus]EGQ9970122.1 glycosyltransferase family 4 protein [Vibrio vulnificus]EGR0234010.1 glycosyltransferase family 4 protein [Vibrio vulnificus]EIJ0943766.1 glycosyltransferase [Vibrio vulnificus]
MNVIINASNLKVGGAIQVAISTIKELHRFPENNYHVFLSPAFEGLIEKTVFEEPNIKIYWVRFPSRFTLSGKVAELDALEEEIGAVCVFSIFGPTYWRPKSTHLAGFALGYYIYRHLPYFKSLGLLEKFRLSLLRNYHKYLLKRHIDEFVVETSDVRRKLGIFLNIDYDKIHVATNTYSSYFSNYEKSPNLGSSNAIGKQFRLLTIAYPYPHKNLAVLKEVSDILNSEGILYIFNVTVSDCFYKKVFQGYEDSIVNLGHVDNKNCPKLYEQVDAMILPTLVECFSASYPEAMVMNRPILTSDYSFAKSICGEAAIYFDPFNPSDIAEKIRLLASDRNLYKGLVSAGSKRLGSFLSPTQRCEKYINLLSMMRDKK